MLFQTIGESGRATFISALRSGLLLIPAVFLGVRFFGLSGLKSAQAIADAGTFLLTLPLITAFIRKMYREDG
ncbi:hypothetical protein [Clostridium sp. AM58-1XD]|uniref:hypothetical protein n=1 Tax=Clostridium sp. AM58-1XD TaxID=2292307 RepID=UPI001FA93FB3|nr:hypothetical protein [Clostridium sp. AM58-1XD]